LIPWLQAARDLRAIEMESAGVYRALRERCPMLAIRGISDLVGLRRSEAWTKYACASAAAFTRAFLRTRPIEVASGDVGHQRPTGVVSAEQGRTRDLVDRARPEDVHAGEGAPPAAPPRRPATTSPPSWTATTDGVAYDLFLTCPSANKASARAFYDLLQPDIRAFLDERSLSPSERWDQATRAAQRASRASVLLLSQRADATWYLGEDVVTAIALHRASAQGHHIMPVLLDPNIALPCSLRHHAAIDLVAAGGPAGVAALLRERVAALHDQPPPSRPLSTSAAEPRGTPDRCDHHRLYDRLCQLGDAIFEQIVVHAAIERAAIASRAAPIVERALDVAQLAALDQTLCRRISAELDRRAPWTRR